MQMLLNLPFQKGHNADFIYCAYSAHIRISKIYKTSLTQWKEIISQDNHTNWDVLMRGNTKDTNCIWKLALFRVLRIFEIRFFESKGVFQGDSLHEYKREWNDFTHMYIVWKSMILNKIQSIHKAQEAPESSKMADKEDFQKGSDYINFHISYDLSI